MKIKKCTRCGKSKPHTLEFFYASDTLTSRLLSHCKDCHKIISKQSYLRRKKKKLKAIGSAYENRLVQYLKRKGIHAGLGRLYRDFKWADVVAWGCIPIELKSSTLHKDGTYRFTFSDTQQRRGLKAKLVCLHIADKNTFHFLPSTCGAFYRDGKLKTGVSYQLTGSRKDFGWDILTPELMSSALNNFHLIEMSRLDIIQSLSKPNTIQLPMFPVEKAS